MKAMLLKVERKAVEILAITCTAIGALVLLAVIYLVGVYYLW